MRTSADGSEQNMQTYKCQKTTACDSLFSAQLAVKRPVSPHVFEVDQPTKFHYKMPINAVSSILNRVTGVALTASESVCSWLQSMKGFEMTQWGLMLSIRAARAGPPVSLPPACLPH